MEILDSRFVGFKYFSLPDVIADDCSSSHFVISAELQSPLLEVADLEMRLSIDGVLAQQGRTSAISGHPADSLVQLCAMLHQHGRTLPAGSIVLAGAATVAETLRPGQEIALEIPGLGAVRVRTSP